MSAGEEKKEEKEEEKKEGEEKKEPEAPKPLNTMTALWKRAKKDVKPEEYNEFYRHLTHDYADPLETIHFSGEGQVEFRALLFLPKQAGMDIYMPNTKRGLSLYVRNVFIGDDFEMLLPEYLRFAKGVVDSADLPLNVSREMLQDDAVIRKIKQAVTSKILSTLQEMKDKKPDAYKDFYAAFGRILKEGVRTDFANADRIKKLLMYYSAKSPEGTRISLDDYVKAMPKDQKDIYFLTAERLEDARHSPQIEQALKHGCDVLFFVDPVDEWLVDDFREYEGKKLVDIAKGDVQFGSEADQKAEKEANEKASADLKPFLDAVKEQLKDNVSDVRVSTRLADSPCCLVAGANALSASMERMLRAMNQEVPHEKRLLEINAAHPLVEKMKGLTGDALKDAVELLYDQALIAEADAIAAEKGIRVVHGVYIGVQGPTFETPAEYKMYHRLGGDAVGMSTVPEVIVAHHCGIRTFGISIITDLGLEDTPVEVSHEEVQVAANNAQPLMTEIMREMIRRA